MSATRAREVIRAAQLAGGLKARHVPKCLQRSSSRGPVILLHPDTPTTCTGDTVVSGPDAPVRPGNTLLLRDMPPGISIYNIELTPGKGGALCRSAGCTAQLLAKKDMHAQVGGLWCGQAGLRGWAAAAAGDQHVDTALQVACLQQLGAWRDVASGGATPCGTETLLLVILRCLSPFHCLMPAVPAPRSARHPHPSPTSPITLHSIGPTPHTPLPPPVSHPPHTLPWPPAGAPAQRRGAPHLSHVQRLRRLRVQPSQPQQGVGQGWVEAAARHQAHSEGHRHEPRGPPPWRQDQRRAALVQPLGHPQQGLQDEEQEQAQQEVHHDHQARGQEGQVEPWQAGWAGRGWSAAQRRNGCGRCRVYVGVGCCGELLCKDGACEAAVAAASCFLHPTI
jgi:hypothetical protein